jgi:type IV conjugative transfer system protein TraL
MEKVICPTLKTLDNPLRILFWSIDEFFSLVGPAIFGVSLGYPWLALAGLFSKPLYSKIRRKLQHGAYKHKTYWVLPTRNLKLMVKTLPPSHNREYVL